MYIIRCKSYMYTLYSINCTFWSQPDIAAALQLYIMKSWYTVRAHLRQIVMSNQLHACIALVDGFKEEHNKGMTPNRTDSSASHSTNTSGTTKLHLVWTDPGGNTACRCYTHVPRPCKAAKLHWKSCTKTKAPYTANSTPTWFCICEIQFMIGRKKLFACKYSCVPTHVLLLSPLLFIPTTAVREQE